MEYLETEAQAVPNESALLAQQISGKRPDQRRSTRLLLSVRIVVSAVDRHGVSLAAPGNTVVVNRHGALIQTNARLAQGMEIVVTVPSRVLSGRARVVWASPTDQDRYGIELETPGDLWGVHFPPAETANGISRQ